MARHLRYYGQPIGSDFDCETAKYVLIWHGSSITLHNVFEISNLFGGGIRRDFTAIYALSAGCFRGYFTGWSRGNYLTTPRAERIRHHLELVD